MSATDCSSTICLILCAHDGCLSLSWYLVLFMMSWVPCTGGQLNPGYHATLSVLNHRLWYNYNKILPWSLSECWLTALLLWFLSWIWYVAVPGKNQTLFRCVFRSHCCIQSTVTLKAPPSLLPSTSLSPRIPTVKTWEFAQRIGVLPLTELLLRTWWCEHNTQWNNVRFLLGTATYNYSKLLRWSFSGCRWQGCCYHLRLYVAWRSFRCRASQFLPNTTKTNPLVQCTSPLTDLWLQLSLCHVTLVDDPWWEEGDEPVEDLCVLASARVARDRAHLKRKVHDKTAIFHLVKA